MTRKSTPILLAFTCLALLALVATGITQQSATEAPTGFETPTLSKDPGSQSTSNGMPEPPGDTFALDQAQFEKRHGFDDGLGPVFNATACVDCHQGVATGSSSQTTEIRAGHLDANKNFVNPTISINHGADTIAGRSIVNDRAICPEAQEVLPNSENIRDLRATLNTLGDGFVEAVDDRTLLAISTDQARRTHGRIHGEAVQVAIFEAPGQTRVGRFGWKDQHGSVLSFAADAYVNEMGITSRLRPKDAANVCKTTADPEDPFDSLGMEDIDHFAQFIRGTKAPPRDPVLAATSEAQAGQLHFAKVGCAICHVSSIVTAPPGTVLNGGNFVVPDALGNKIIHPYGDFLLHDVGTGDGIVQGGPADTANKLRTAPLWGLRTKARFMHDLKSESLEDAINRHRGEAREVVERFRRDLSPRDRQELISFLQSL